MDVPVAESKPPVLVPFICPVCAVANGAHLISLSRAGGQDCAGCGKWLKAADVMRAIHSPRTEQPAQDSVQRQHAARVATRGGTRTREVSRKDSIVWPPTAESRAAVKPLYRRR